MTERRLLVVRILALFVVALGVSYLWWRWQETVAWEVWWIAVPLILAETYSLSESVLYSFTMWNSRRRAAPPPAPAGKTVDVFVVTCNEPLDIVLQTAIAARNMTYPHKTWILDDGDRPEFATAARRIGVGYLNRGPDWEGKPRFAKAGNVNNALFRTSGEFIAIFDADQVPDSQFLDRVLGYFLDPDIAFVQTPQQFWNMTRSDPLGSGADLFYGPIQQGKDGWGAALFCGSNAVLRREALMAVGLTQFSRTASARVREEIRSVRRGLRSAVKRSDPADRETREVGRDAMLVLSEAAAKVRRGEVLADVTCYVRHWVRSALATKTIDSEVAAALRSVLDRVDVARTSQALALDPIHTGSVTEDTATGKLLHAMGWASVYHHEVLVRGLAPEDIRTMMSQRQRWAAGTMQGFFSDNPLVMRGLTIGQRLMYLATMTSYLNGFAVIVYIAAPITFLVFGVFPIHADSTEFFFFFIPYYFCCQALFVVGGNRARGLWRGQQMSFSLFPTWIRATMSAAKAAVLGKPLTFAVTHKRKQDSGVGLRHIRPQLVAMAALVGATGYGVIQALAGNRPIFATVLTLLWVAMDVVLLASMVRAARFRGPGEAAVNPLPDEIRTEVDTVTHEAGAVVKHAHDVTDAEPPAGAALVDAAADGHHRAATRFDAEAALVLRSDIVCALEQPSPVVLIDISAVSTVTPSGAAAMVDLMRMVHACGADLRLFGDSRAFAQAHKAMALSRITRIYLGREEASRMPSAL